MSSVAELQARLAARKRAATEAASSGGEPAKRWRRKGDVDAAQAKAYVAEREARAKARAKASSANGGAKPEDAAQGIDAKDRCVKVPAATETGAEEPERDRGRQKPEERDPPPLDKDEVIRRLRALGEPATLYGETDWIRFRRLRDLGLAREAEGSGQKNIFQDKMREIERQDAVRQAHEYAGAEYLEPETSQKHLTGSAKLLRLSSRAAGDSRSGHGNSASGEVTANTSGANPEAHAPNAATAEHEPSCNEEYVLCQIRRVLALWQGDVDGMTLEARRTNKGRTAAVTLEQTKEWLKPLMRQLKHRRLKSNILNALVNIFRAVEEREYVRANSFYYEQLAIGNAPWPMGATMVGIHARAAREKIGEDKIAHVMNDEQSRKYIQAIKRLVSKCQAHFPTVPSKMISS